MIKIFGAKDKDFSSAGDIIINPIKCIEIKKKSLNGWYIEVEMDIKYKEYITKDKLCVIKSISKLNPQAFRISENIQYTAKKIKFTANHIMFDAQDYFLVDVRPTKLDGLNALNYINNKTDEESPFKIYSNVTTIETAYFIRKNLLEAWATIEERWNGVFEADNWDISFLTEIGNDNGETINYGQNLKNFEVYEDWSNVVTKLYPTGPDGLMLPEEFIESEIKYEKPYTKTVEFQTEIEQEEQTTEKLIQELRQNANNYLENNCKPQISYTINANIFNNISLGDTIHIKHPIVDIKTEVLEYQYNIISNKIISLTFGNFNRDVKTKFENIKNTINQINKTVSKQEGVINKQTHLINTLNKNGLVYIDDNEILILDKIPKEEAKNVWRFGLGGIGFSSNGYEGPFETAMTQDGQINADFITTGTIAVSRIESLSDIITQVISQEQQLSEVTHTINELNSKISDIADVTVSKESLKAILDFENINQSEPIYIHIHPTNKNISYLYPRDNLYPSDDLFMTTRTLRFTNTTTKEIWNYELPDDLLVYDSENYDELLLDYNSQTLKINKRCGWNEDGTVKLLDGMITYNYTFPKIELTDGDYTIELVGYTEAYMFVRLMAANYYTTQFATKTEMNSEMKQTKEEIDSSVNKKLSNYSTTTEMNAAINIKANQITDTVKQTYATKELLEEEKSERIQTASSISSEVSKKVGNDEVISKINQSAENVRNKC